MKFNVIVTDLAFHNRMSHNNHGHTCGGGHNHDCDACCAENLRGAEFNLYLKIDMEGLTCLNESEDGSGKTVFRAFEDRLDKEKFVASDADAELLFNIPFLGSVKLKGMLVIGGEHETHPDKMRLFKNRPTMSFEDVQAKADQEIELHVDQTGSIEYNPIVARFSDVRHLSIHFPSNHGNCDRTEVYYIGLKGDFTEAHRHEVTITAYETTANPADHKTSTLNSVNFMVS